MAKLITIDGSEGEGGGQILRTSLALALVTGQPFRIVNVRAGRAKPGLLRQHLTATNAAVAISDGAVDGAEIGSREIVFRPGAVRAGEYRFAVGTAGNATLVLQTVLPALMLAAAPSRLTLEGGTHNPFAPPFDFLARTFLPQLARFGPRVAATLARPGFFPAGGGKMEIAIEPCAKLRPIELIARGADAGRRVTAHFAGLPAAVARRGVARVCEAMNWPGDTAHLHEHPEDCGPGLTLVAEVASAEITEVFTGFGERGVRIEQIADDLAAEVRAHLSSCAPVGEHLADQLLIPLALAGSGCFHTTGLTRHARTNMDVIAQFLPARFVAGKLADGTIKVRCATHAVSAESLG